MNKHLLDPGFTLWFTGLPCSGKTTIADLVAKKLKIRGIKTERLDGDIVRKNITKDLGFSKKDRDQNIERIAYVSKLLSRNGVAVIASFVSPYKKTRKMVRKQTTNFIEIYLNCPLKTCEERDTKGMYKKARQGKIKKFTGIDDPYEKPENPELILDTQKKSSKENADIVINMLQKRKLIIN